MAYSPNTIITDPITSANQANVTAASGAAIAANKALVVALSPNSPLPVGANVIGAVTQSGTWTTTSLAEGSVTPGTAASKSMLGGGIYNSTQPTLTNGQQASLQLKADGDLSVSIDDPLPSGSNVIGAVTQSGTWNIGSIATLPSLPAGSNAIGSVSVSNFPATQTVSGTVAVSSLPALATGSNVIGAVTQSGTWNITNISGTISLPTGAATAALQTTANASLASIDNAVGPVTPGTVATNSYLIGGQYNATVPTLTDTQQSAIQLDSRGALQVTILDGCRATYSATSAIAFSSASTATDIFTITGSSTKTVRIIKIGFSATQTTASAVNVLLIKRSSANTGGTSATATAVPNDSNDAAATATVRNYTANPTGLGTAIGTIRAVRAFIPTTSLASTSQYYEFDFGTLAEKSIVLRGTAQVLSLNLNSTTISGGAWTCWIEWTEE